MLVTGINRLNPGFLTRISPGRLPNHLNLSPQSQITIPMAKTIPPIHINILPPSRMLTQSGSPDENAAPQR